MITNLSLGLNGRLGNQIFQFAALFALSKKLKTNIQIPEENLYLVDGKNQDYECSLDLFNCFDIPNELLVRKSSIAPVFSYQEPHFHYSPDFWEIQNNTAIRGYFQSEKYFASYREELLAFFKFKPLIEEMSRNILKDIRHDEKLVGVHVRRGDFIKEHMNYNQSYYLSAMRRFERCTFVIVSDDIGWCQDAFGQRDNLYFATTTSRYVDLCLLSLCDHNIICNSSFSWWGSWLNPNKKKIIIAPSVWFFEGVSFERHKLNTSDLYCPNWTVLEGVNNL